MLLYSTGAWTRPSLDTGCRPGVCFGYESGLHRHRRDSQLQVSLHRLDRQNKLHIPLLNSPKRGSPKRATPEQHCLVISSDLPATPVRVPPTLCARQKSGESRPRINIPAGYHTWPPCRQRRINTSKSYSTSRRRPDQLPPHQ